MACGGGQKRFARLLAEAATPNAHFLHCAPTKCPFPEVSFPWFCLGVYPSTNNCIVDSSQCIFSLLSTGMPSAIYLPNPVVPVPLRRSLSGEMSDAEDVEPTHSDGTDDETINRRHLMLPHSSGRTFNGGSCRPFDPAFYEARSNSYYIRGFLQLESACMGTMG